MQERTHTTSLPTDKFLTVAVNLLNKAFLEAARTDAKRLYKDLESGEVAQLTVLQLEDQSRLRFDLALNHSEYQGKLTYGSFRTGLTLLIARIADVLRAGEPIRTLADEQNPRSVLFMIPIATTDTETGRHSVLMLGAESREGEPSMLLNLAYIDYSQFEEQQAVQMASADASDTEADTNAGQEVGDD